MCACAYACERVSVCVCLGKGKILWHGRENYYKECLCHFRKFAFAFLDVCNIMNNDWEIVFKLWKQLLRKVKSAKVPGWDSHFVSPRKRVFVISGDTSVRSSLLSFKLVQRLYFFCIPLMLIQTPPSLWHHCFSPWKTAVSFLAETKNPPDPDGIFYCHFHMFGVRVFYLWLCFCTTIPVINLPKLQRQPVLRAK